MARHRLVERPVLNLLLHQLVELILVVLVDLLELPLVLLDVLLVLLHVAYQPHILDLSEYYNQSVWRIYRQSPNSSLPEYRHNLLSLRARHLRLYFGCSFGDGRSEHQYSDDLQREKKHHGSSTHGRDRRAVAEALRRRQCARARAQSERPASSLLIAQTRAHCAELL